MAIHPTAVVHADAQISSSADIGPYCCIGPSVRIGNETRLLSHVVVDGDTVLGERNIVHPFARVGGVPQDLKFAGEPARLRIGNDNTIREGVTINIGTDAGGAETRIGNDCMLMAYSHVAHDCQIGDHVILSNSVAIAGHVHVGEYAIFGGLAGVHQFCRVGRHAFVAAGAMVAQDVPPFCIAQGDRARLVGINVVGLKRAGWSRELLASTRKGFRDLFQGGPTRLVALERTEGGLAKEHPEVLEMTQFVREAERGVCAPRQTQPLMESVED